LAVGRYITDLARLVGSQITSDEHRIFICRRCLTHFGTQNLLNMHEKICGSLDPVKCVMPKDARERTCDFKNYQFQQHIPYVIYADLESALEPFDTVERDPNKPESFTEKKHRHTPTSYIVQ